MNYIEHKWNSFSRYVLWHYLSKKLNLIHITEYPKSGGTWLTQLISSTTGLPTRRNELPKYERSVMHGHYLFSDKFNKSVCVVRDGRDVVVSYYHHLIIGNDNMFKSDLKKKRLMNRRELLGFEDINDVKSNLPKFIEYLHSDYAKKLNGFTWGEFIDSYLNKDNVLVVKYEDMLLNTAVEVERVLDFIDIKVENKKIQSIVDKYSFKNQTSRVPGQEDKKSFLRKGISGDWKNYFNKESAHLFDKYYGDVLIALEYEKDKNWVNQ